VGDLVITRSNDRRLRVSGTDWVKNGDRWTIQAVTANGDLRVRHTQHHRTAQLPAAYVEGSVELGYATTVHTAQGVSADTMHGLAGGQESRQQLYTMMTRGRNTNHLYLQVVGDGDLHTVIAPEMVTPSTPTDLLEQILARDDAPQSASTYHREHHHPSVRLGEAATRYTDALHAAAEVVAGPERIEALHLTAERTVAGLTEESAWPTLRAHLLLLAVAGVDPEQQLEHAARRQQLGDADDRAAVIDWRLHQSRALSAVTGPLPWLPAIPSRLADHPTWGAYLQSRSQLVADLAGQVRQHTQDGDPAPWNQRTGLALPPHLVEDVTVWRAAMQVDPGDLRPTGPQQLQHAADTWQQHLDHAIAGETPACQEWSPLIENLAPGTGRDPFAPVLASRLAAVSRAGINARALLKSAASAGPLPDDHAAAALWWRISRHLSPAVASQADDHHVLTTPWTAHLSTIIGSDHATRLQGSQWWPPLVTAVDHALARGWQLEQLLNTSIPNPDQLADACQQLVWRISVLTDPTPDDDPIQHLDDTPPEYQPSDDRRLPPASENDRPPLRIDHQEPAQRVDSDETSISAPADDDRWLEADLAVAAMIRDHAGPPEQTDTEIAHMIERATAWQESPVTRKRMLQINRLTWNYYRNQFPHSWARDYLTARLRQDLTHHPDLPAGHAPAGWTSLVDHLRRHGIADHEMTATGVATLASTGRLIDRFRDRVMFPITHDGVILGFVGRRHPELTDNHQGPKYLNTADTPLFHKGAQLYCPAEHHLTQGAIPVIVEGPMDALAVTIATNGRHVGVAPLGTTLTHEQAAQLVDYGINPIVATDGDLPGRVAAERHFWILTSHRLDPLHAQLPDGNDPADLLADHSAQRLNTALATARPLSDLLITERLAHLPPDQALHETARIIAASPTNRWDNSTDTVSKQLHLPLGQIREQLLELAKQWTTDPRQAALPPLHNIHHVKERLAAAAHGHTEGKGQTHDRVTLAEPLDPRLPQQDDWPGHNLLQKAHQHGNDATPSEQPLAQNGLEQGAVQDLTNRLDAALDATRHQADTSAAKTGRQGATTRRTKPAIESPNSPQLPNSGMHR
jgi:DNA primase catalytic core